MGQGQWGANLWAINPTVVLSDWCFRAVEYFQTPHVLLMVNPYWALSFALINPMWLFLTMGAVILTIGTGGEALYDDMGHFGRLPIRLAWFIICITHVCY